MTEKDKDSKDTKDSKETLLKRTIHLLENSDEFKRWKEENKDAFLANAFTMFEKEPTFEWHMGYYDKEKDMITSFQIQEHQIIKNPASEALKKDDSHIEELNLDKVTVDVKEALEKANQIHKEKYEREKPTKIMVLAQHMDGKNIWNITYVTQSLKMMNVKINAETGKIESDNLISIIQSTQPGEKNQQ